MIEKVLLMQTVQWSARIRRITSVLERWNRNFTTRRQLRALDAHQLCDIGIDRIAAEQEANKPFWQN